MKQIPKKWGRLPACGGLPTRPPQRVGCRPAALVLALAIFTAVPGTAQTPPTGPIWAFTATTDNVASAHDSIRINLLRWSTDAERDQMFSAWTQPGASPAGRGARPRAVIDETDPAQADVNATAGGRGGAGRGGRGGGRGGDGSAAAAPRPTPESSLKTALGNAPTVGYLWSSEVAGYSLRYAVRLPEQDGGERIIFITDRRLGAANDLWKPVGSGAATNYEFSLVELHVNSKGEGEGKISLTGKVAADSAAKAIALENYGALPVVLKNVKRQNSESVRSK
jgi:hypothetical protein